MDRDPEAFRALYEAHYGSVCRYLARRVDAGAIEDVAAETFLVAWRRQADLPAHVLPWLLTTASKLRERPRRETDRELLLLRHWDGLAPREAAAVLGLGPVLVRTRMHRAERRLRTALRAALEDEDTVSLPIELTEVT